MALQLCLQGRIPERSCPDSSPGQDLEGVAQRLTVRVCVQLRGACCRSVLAHAGVGHPSSAWALMCLLVGCVSGGVCGVPRCVSWREGAPDPFRAPASLTSSPRLFAGEGTTPGPGWDLGVGAVACASQGCWDFPPGPRPGSVPGQPDSAGAGGGDFPSLALQEAGGWSQEGERWETGPRAGAPKAPGAVFYTGAGGGHCSLLRGPRQAPQRGPQAGCRAGVLRGDPSPPSCASPPPWRSCYWKQLLSVGGPLLFPFCSWTPPAPGHGACSKLGPPTALPRGEGLPGVQLSAFSLLGQWFLLSPWGAPFWLPPIPLTPPALEGGTLWVGGSEEPRMGEGRLRLQTPACARKQGRHSWPCPLSYGVSVVSLRWTAVQPRPEVLSGACSHNGTIWTGAASSLPWPVGAACGGEVHTWVRGSWVPTVGHALAQLTQDARGRVSCPTTKGRTQSRAGGHKSW